MADEPTKAKKNSDDRRLDQQFRRALTSFEGVVLHQNELRNKLANRLNYSIRTGLIILGAIAISILILLLTLSAQINRISSVVGDMNEHFASVSKQMSKINVYISSIEQRVALLDSIKQQTEIMDKEMKFIAEDLDTMRMTVGGISSNVNLVRNNVGAIAVAIDRMDVEVMQMSQDMQRISKPARSMNKMFPFLP